MALDGELSAELRATEIALRRIDTGDYEYCMRCGEEIGEARLNVLPSVTLCIKCAEAQDRG